jgi:hypothetical protein
MNEAIVIQWLQRNWLAFILAFIPPLIAEMKGRPKTRWYLYGLASTLVAWPLVSLPTVHAAAFRHGQPVLDLDATQAERIRKIACMPQSKSTTALGRVAVGLLLMVVAAVITIAVMGFVMLRIGRILF